VSWLRGGADLLSAPPRPGEASAKWKLGLSWRSPRVVLSPTTWRGITITLLTPNHSRFEGVPFCQGRVSDSVSARPA
jgi:hypothetical protein